MSYELTSCHWRWLQLCRSTKISLLIKKLGCIHLTLAGQQRDIDLLDHLDPVQHLGQRLAAERLRGVPDGRVGHAGALGLQVEHVVAGAHGLGAAGRKHTTACMAVELQA